MTAFIWLGSWYHDDMTLIETLSQVKIALTFSVHVFLKDMPSVNKVVIPGSMVCSLYEFRILH